MPDFKLFELGGISVIVLVFGIVETAKKFGLSGTWCQILAIVLGALLVGASQAITQGLIPANAIPWINIVVIGAGGGLAAGGVFDVIKKRMK